MKGLHELEAKAPVMDCEGRILHDVPELRASIDRLTEELRSLRCELGSHIKMAYVEVSGTDCAIGGDRGIVFEPTIAGGDWRRAKGVLDLGDEKPEDIVRRMRDGLSPINQGGK